MTDLLNKVTQGDCLDVSKGIESGSVDLILTDLPYGNMNTDGGRKLGINGWDMVIEPEKVYEIANRILRKNGKMVLFSQEPYTTRLISEAISKVPFSYRMVWEKDSFANALGCRKAPVSFYEDILVFSKYEEDKTGHVLQEYFYTEFKKCGLTIKEICEKLGTTHASHFFTRGKQFRVPNEKYLCQLQALTGRFKISYEEVVKAQQDALDSNRNNYPSTFNLWEGNKYKSNILKYKKDYSGYHPTQKPVLLLEDLIKTFSNEGDTVVDLTAGSGSTAVACVNTNRNFIAIEREKEYVEIANKRIEDAAKVKGGN
ncbi:DNA-methyltransferase [Robertmurraya andreesenii]|uniref:Methyltransferase n=1 Tax=Anoxybacillus andreesenii TaxID=1325932 RepID=A0ABT9V1Y0_9BACL|nr:site-specific DNA-methyltransferase [Robertmurraya andreesenii]MDQ0154921.1 site-specific DNA-methyltransferase (adenine-specific) [Robertmurraya andreesenii]